ncbi:MAG: hypothetical protein CR966_01320 [Pseudomonadales bacterium]|nr:MAG: hypothetical protein CR966_01320 [Pseudomonadales bacterium]
MKKSRLSTRVLASLFAPVLLLGVQQTALAESSEWSDSFDPIEIVNDYQRDGLSETDRQLNSFAKTALLNQATDIQLALAKGDYANVTQHIHPKKGVQFSMYAYVQPKKDKRFSRQQFATYLKKSRVRFTWGEMDGSGHLLVIPLPTYLDEWVQAVDFNNAEVTINQSQGSGNSLNNIESVYPYANAKFAIVDFYNKGSKEYDGMDWRAMRLVFEEYQGKSYLVAVVNDEWTI